VQSNFMMNNCSLLPPHAALTANRAITITYRANGHEGSQQITVLAARIILSRWHGSKPVAPRRGFGRSGGSPLAKGGCVALPARGDTL